MARIVHIEEGAYGVVTAATDEGSLFRLRAAYLELAYGELGLGAAPGLSAPAVTADAPALVDDAALAAAAAALDAELAAVRLLSRAEQHRAGLVRKLMARKLPKAAIQAALDRLEGQGLLSDERYAAAWARQRLRSRAEGPRSLEAGLAERGVDRAAIRAALGDILAGEGRAEAVARAAAWLMKKTRDPVAARSRLVELGWKTRDIDDDPTVMALLEFSELP